MEELIIPSLEDPDCIFSSVIPHIKKPWYYKFNNSTFFLVKEKMNLQKCFINYEWKVFKILLKN